MNNGVYDAVSDALAEHTWTEFGGIEPNPTYETLVRGIAAARDFHADFIVAVGGGSVIDGSKLISSALATPCDDPWELMTGETHVRAALPLGTILTLPAAGSEMNPHAIVSRKNPPEKLALSSPLLYPRFSILDPAVTFSLPPRQVSNSIVDPFVHVLEQYLTYPVGAPLQDRFAESILLTLTETGPRTLDAPEDYDARAVMMWSATMALNGMISCGVPQDWATHAIGHELKIGRAHV